MAPRTIVIAQARMGSNRFPGKVLYPFQGKPALSHLIDALLHAVDRSDIVIATSERPENDGIRTFCAAQDIAVFSGDETNVASRFAAVAEQQAADYFIRVCADSPVLDPGVIRKVHDLALQTRADVVSNSINHSVPWGMVAEAVSSPLFVREFPKFSKPEHFEHVTAYFYQNKEKFRIVPYQPAVPQAEKYNFCFDTEEDRKRLEKFFEALSRPHYDYSLEEKCALYRELFF